MKNLGLVLLATVAISPARMLADTIVLEFAKTTFTSAAPTVTGTKNGSITGVGGTGLAINVSDTPNPTGFDINPNGSSVTTGVTIGSIVAGGGSWTVAGDQLTAVFLGNGGSLLEVTSSACTGGTEPGVCLSGTAGFGTLQITSGTHLSGDFTGGFTPTYISPYITGLFGDPTLTPAELAALNPGGGFATYLTLPTNAPLSSSTTSVSEILDGQGFISVNVLSATPEPSSLMLLGTGLLILAFAAFRKAKSSGSDI
jgi:hypothetical protein